MKLHTKRLTLNPTGENDCDTLFRIVTNDVVRKYLFDNEVLSMAQVEDLLATSIKTFQLKRYGLWLINHDELNGIIGFVGLWHFFEEPQPQLLYALLPAFKKQGYASEASKEIIRYAFEELHFNYLSASCDTPNGESHKVAERAGMKKSKEQIMEGKPITFYQIDKF